MTARQFQPGDRFTSGKGLNLMEARLVAIEGRIARMEYRRPGPRGVWRPFKLALRFLSSPSCGWKPTP